LSSRHVFLLSNHLVFALVHRSPGCDWVPSGQC
jgi:hypothetical protein